MNTKANSRRGFSLIEIMIVVTIILVIATIAIPRLDSSRQLANELAAVRMIHTLHTAQAQHYAQFGRYAPELSKLGPLGAHLIPESLASGEHSGYRFVLSGSGNAYAVSVTPEQYGKSGRRTFYSDETGILREHWGPEPADVHSEEVKAKR